MQIKLHNMKSIRLRITHLIKKIQEILPDGNDILGFAGISKPIIIDSLNESYSLLSTISNYPDTFETIFAKREIAENIDNANNLLNLSFTDENGINVFNELLRSVSKIKFIIKDTYISVCDNPLRAEQDIARAKEELSELESTLAGISDTKNQLEAIKTDSKSFVDDLRLRHETSIGSESRINTLLTSVTDLEKNLQGTTERINLWKSEILAIKDDIINKQGDITKIKKEVEQTQEISQVNTNESDTLIKTLKSQLELNNTHQENIKSTIEDVSRLGMAGSFKKRKDELKWAQWIWACLTILSLFALMAISYWIMKPLVANGAANLNGLFFKIPMFASTVWLGWFCSRQYGFNTRIREDYAYKYAISMAFEGYKNETREINPELLEKLIELTILNAARSPERIFNSKTNHGSPYNEIIDNLIHNFFGQKKDNIDKSLAE